MIAVAEKPPRSRLAPILDVQNVSNHFSSGRMELHPDHWVRCHLYPQARKPGM